MALQPTSGLPAIAMPPPTPVPRLTPKTTSRPAAAPSAVSERARQLALFIRRTGRRSAAVRSRSRGPPGQQGELAFLNVTLGVGTAPGHHTRHLPHLHLEPPVSGTRGC